MDATDKTAERLLEWFRHYAPKDGVRIYDDKDGVSIGVDGHIQICKVVSFLLHGNATVTPGPPPALAGASLPKQEVIQAALQNLPPDLVASAAKQKS